MRKYYPGLTLFKFAGAVLVVMSHIREFPLQDALDASLPYFSTLCTVIVPCFYVMAGFLACQGWSRAAAPQRYVKNYIKWLGGVYLFFFLLVVGGDLVLFGYNGVFPRNPNYYLELFLTGPYPQFGFLPPLLVAVGLGFLADRYGSLRVAVVLSAGGYLLAAAVIGPLRVGTNYLVGDLPLFHSRYFFWIEEFLTKYLSTGFPYVLAGICIARRETAFLRISKGRFVLLALLASVVEIKALQQLYPERYSYYMLLSQVPLTLLLFYGLLKVNTGWVQRYHVYLRQLSLFLFFAHWPLMLLNAMFMGTPCSMFSLRQSALCMVLTFGEVLLLERVFALLFRRRKEHLSKGLPATVPVSKAAVQQRENGSPG